jgi:hypothetical protein
LGLVALAQLRLMLQAHLAEHLRSDHIVLQLVALGGVHREDQVVLVRVEH